MPDLLLCQQSFSSKSTDYRFLTFRGPDAKHQKIGFVSDLCKKISKTYLIVRERNKRVEGCHFHALIRVDSEPNKSWFKKGCHMHLQKIGKPQNKEGMKMPTPWPSGQEIWEMYGQLPLEEAQAEHLKVIVEKQMYIESKQTKCDKNITNVLKYMSKELEMPCQYTDYIYVVSGKNQTIPF